MNRVRITVNEGILAKIKELRPEFIVHPKIGEEIFISEKLQIWVHQGGQALRCLLTRTNEMPGWREEVFNEFLKEKYPEVFL